MLLCAACSEQLVHVRLPTNVEQLKALGAVLAAYKDDYRVELLVAIFLTYSLCVATSAAVAMRAQPRPWRRLQPCDRRLTTLHALCSLQTFSIPGSLTLCILVGYLFPLYVSVPVMCLVRCYAGARGSATTDTGPPASCRMALSVLCLRTLCRTLSSAISCIACLHSRLIGCTLRYAAVPIAP